MINEILHGYAVAIAEDARADARLSRVRDDVGVFYSAMRASDSLHQALTDTALSAVDRRGIVADLVIGRAADEAADLLGFAVRVVAPPDLFVAAADLCVFLDDALDAGNELLDVAAPAGREGARLRVRGYAERVLQHAAPHVLDEVEDQLFRFARLLEANPPLRRALEDPNFNLEARLGLLADLLSQKVEPQALRLTQYVLRAGRVRNLVGAYDGLVHLVAAERGRRLAEVRSAVELSDEERARLRSALGRLVGREVEVRVVIDPSVIGGVMISIGDLFIDGTVRLRFERLRDQFAQRL